MTTRLPDPFNRSESRAVLIGVGSYDDPEFPPVPAALNSLEAMRRVLTNLGLCGWPAERVTVLRDPRNAGRVARTLRELAREAREVLLLYYVGHGKLTVHGQLCLAVADSVADSPDYTGIAYSWLAQALRESPARAKITILDCCFSGQAIEALAAGSSGGLADLTHVAGAYTLTATTRNQPAHVPPLVDQRGSLTSFTSHLLGLLREGIPDGPAYLTFADLFPHLRSRLAAAGLPLPRQRGTDTADRYPFARNLAVPASGPPAGGATRRAAPPDLSPPSDRPAPLRRLVNRRAVLAATATAGAAGAAGLLIPRWLEQQPRSTVLSSPTTGPHTTSPAIVGSTATRNASKSSPQAKNFISDLYVSALAIGWLGDTAIAVTGSIDNTVRMWNLTTFEQHGETMKGTPDLDPEDGGGWINAVAVGRVDGKTIAVSGGADDIVVWDLETCRRYGTPLTGIGHVRLVSLAQLGDRTFVVSNHGRGTSVVIWDLETREQYDQLDGLAGTSAATSLAVGQLGSRTIIAAGAQDEDPLMWDLESGRRHGKPLKGHSDTVTSMAIGQLGDDKAIAVSGSLDGTVRVWELESGQQRGNPLKGHSRGVHWVAIGRLHGKSIAVSVDGDNAMRVWDLESGHQHGETLPGRLPIHLSAALGRLGDRTIVLSSEWKGNGGQMMTRLWDLGPA